MSNKVIVSTVIIVQREEEMPEKCPKCEADFKEPRSIRKYYQQNHYISGRLPSENGELRDEEYADKGIVLDPSTWCTPSEDVDDDVDGILYLCAACRTPIFNEQIHTYVPAHVFERGEILFCAIGDLTKGIHKDKCNFKNNPVLVCNCEKL